MTQRRKSEGRDSRAKRSMPAAVRYSARSPKDAKRPVNTLSDQPADTSQMLEQLFLVVMEFADRQGLTATDCKAAFNRAQRRLTKTPYRLGEANRSDTYYQIGEMLTSWHRDADYLDDQGAPKSLKVTDDRFSGLSQRHLPAYQPQEVASFMVQEGLLEKAGHHVKPRRRGALCSASNRVTTALTH